MEPERKANASEFSYILQQEEVGTNYRRVLLDTFAIFII